MKNQIIILGKHNKQPSPTKIEFKYNDFGWLISCYILKRPEQADKFGRSVFRFICESEKINYDRVVEEVIFKIWSDTNKGAGPEYINQHFKYLENMLVEIQSWPDRKQLINERNIIVETITKRRLCGVCGVGEVIYPFEFWKHGKCNKCGQQHRRSV